MDKIWHLRKDGKLFPVKFHLYVPDEPSDITIKMIEWLWDKVENKNGFHELALTYIKSYALNKLGSIENLFSDLENDDLSPSPEFMYMIKDDVYNAPVGDYKKLNQEIADLIDNQFIRVRICNGNTVIRINSKNNFDWTTVIYDFVSSHRNLISYVTVAREDKVLNSDYIYRYKDTTYFNMPIEEFLQKCMFTKFN